MNFSLVVATDENLGIGLKGDLPWKIKSDLKYFRDLTSLTKDKSKKNAVIMGRTTWESIPEKFRPLPNRLNIILSRNQTMSVNGAELANSIDQALEISKRNSAENCFVIGGGKVYQEAIHSPFCQSIYITEIKGNFSCDTFFPNFKNHFKLLTSTEDQHENNIIFRFSHYIKK